MHDDWKPFCPACNKPLNGAVVASRCNHVFHKECAPRDDAKCPKCNAGEAGKGSQELFGLGFPSAKAPGAAQMTPEAKEAAVEVFKMKRQIEEQKRTIQEYEQRVADAREVAEKELVKFNDAEKQCNKTKDKYTKAKADLEKATAKKDTLYEEVNRMREQSIAGEYLNILLCSKDGGADAAGFISRMAGSSFDAGPVLTELMRLRNHYRERMSKLQKEHIELNRRHAKLGRDISEVKRGLAEDERRLHRARSEPKIEDPLEATQGLEMAPKRQRLVLGSGVFRLSPD